jgi:hypothetical protein
MQDFSSLALTNALYTAGGLPDAQKLALVDEVLDGGRSIEVHVGVAVARLLGTIEDTEGRAGREQKLLAAVPEDAWQARAMLQKE